MVTRFAEAGALVVAHGNRSFARAEELRRQLTREGRAVAALEADLRDPAACIRFLEEAFQTFGGVDVWINNAGADILTGERFQLTFEEKLRELLAVDVQATVLLTREAGGRMRKSRGGCIINMGWDGALVGMEGDSGELFAAAKGAVISFTKSAALSLAPEVRVNCIAPGWIRTGWGERAGPGWQERVLRETPLGRWGLPEDVAHVAMFLASADAKFLTGQVFCVNGGSVR
jgi:3-oxoacyl-[acyl-carrier protein] reductase